MSTRVATVAEIGTLALFVTLALRWAWTQNGWFEPYTVLCGCMFIGLDLYRRFGLEKKRERAKPPEIQIKAGLPASFGRGQKQWPVFDIDGVTTPPLFALKAFTLDEIPSFASGKCNLVYDDPDYDSKPYDLSPEWLQRIAADPAEAKRMVNAWHTHQSQFAYFIQFRDDPTRQKIKALHNHTALISALCDGRLGIDTGDLWDTFNNLTKKEHVYLNYRADPDRESKYGNYANNLVQIHESGESSFLCAMRLIERIERQIDWKAPAWATLPPLLHASLAKAEGRKVRLFYSYSHKDKRLRDKLESHLAVLQRNGVIENWHDRRIGAGDDWQGRIAAELESADIILLLISSDFLNSNYCYDVETKRALERHAQGSAKVIPIILKPCLWTDAPFGKLQALPTDGKAVTTWSNQDRAFTDIATGLSDQIRHWSGTTATS